MSHQLTVPKYSLQALAAEGYDVEVRHGYLVVHSVPYVSAGKTIEQAVLACPYVDTNDDVGRPDNHVMLFAGAIPCTSQGQPIPSFIADSNNTVLFDKFTVNHRLSNKPSNDANFPTTYYEKVRHYVDILESQAQGIDPNATARTGQVRESREANPIFVYPDSASPRAGTVAVNQKLNGLRVAIIGLGGTGSYILDQIAKTWIKEIHLFDGDDFSRHNAFRAPGAASIENLRRRLSKVDYYTQMYSAMRNDIYAHPIYINADSVGRLNSYDFVFVAVDDGPSRKLICDHLAVRQISFADVGIGLMLDEESGKLFGNARITLGTPGNFDHLTNCLPVIDNNDGDIYKTNIQVSEMNAINALLAVMRFKQRYGFYVDYENAHEITFSVSSLSIVRQEKRQL